MGDMKQAARSVMAAQLVAGIIAEHSKPLKADLLADMTDLGAERIRVTDDDGTDLGAVSISAGRTTAKVTDRRAFVDWVARRYPNELEHLVRAAFEKKLLDAATAAGDPVDAATGEIIPGVEVLAGDPYVTMRPTVEAKARMRETLQSAGLLQLPSGGAK
jgi:hypothetical protein